MNERDRTGVRTEREIELGVIGNGRSHRIHKNTNNFLKENNFIHKNNYIFCLSYNFPFYRVRRKEVTLKRCVAVVIRRLWAVAICLGSSYCVLKDLSLAEE